MRLCFILLAFLVGSSSFARELSVITSYPLEEVSSITNVGKNKFNVTCKDGSLHLGVTGQEVIADQLCVSHSEDLSQSSEIAIGLEHTCVIVDTQIKCWGGNSFGQLNVPAGIKNPSSLTAGVYHTCAITDQGVVCWGSEASVPAGLRSPTQVVANSYGNSCALTSDGVKCWHLNGALLAVVPPLENPTQLSAGSSHACAITNEGVKCWNVADYTGKPGPRDSLMYVPRDLKNPTRLATSDGDRTCAITDNGIQCWQGYFEINGYVWAPTLSRPTQISASGNRFCALADEGVVCWGGYSNAPTVPPLKNPTRIVANGGGGFKTCAYTDDGVICWSDLPIHQ